ncbi:SUKH-4 family immunity protein [Streptomyces xiangluensis]|uniref:SUKH-4 family immunity protein n=1 Tax=Streptomyces xiangluensis TaxID=2665720 RepID=A0ABV8Z1P1_9ACTN
MRTIDAGTGTCATAWGEVPAYWRMTALVHALTRITDPCAGLRIDLPARLLDEEFGTGGIMRFEDVDFPATLTHEPTRRFLRETGLPEDGVTFQLEMDVPLQTLAERYAPERTEEVPVPGGQLPDAADRLIRLGRLADATDLLVDGTTGELHEWSAPAAGLRPLNADISTLAFTLWLLHRASCPTP